MFDGLRWNFVCKSECLSWNLKQKVWWLNSSPPGHDGKNNNFECIFFVFVENSCILLKFHWLLFLIVQLPIIQYWLPGAWKVPSHHLNQWWRNVLPGLNELNNGTYQLCITGFSWVFLPNESSAHIFQALNVCYADIWNVSLSVICKEMKHLHPWKTLLSICMLI